MELNDLDKIEAYLSNKMELEEKQAFEQRLQEDVELAMETKKHSEMMQYIDGLGDRELMEKISKAHQQYTRKQTPTKGKVRWLRPLLAAASIALLLLAGYWLLQPAPTNDALYTAYYEAYPLSFGSRDAGSNEDLLAATALYQQGEYAQALPQFQSLLQVKANNKLRLALGICQLELERFPDAIEQFEFIINQQDPLFVDQALWYRALAFLKSDQVAATQADLSTLAARPKAPHYQQALDLQQALKTK